MEASEFVPSHVSEIAEHLSAAGIVERAISYYEAAGEIAASGDDYARAAQWYRRAIALEAGRGRTRPALIRKLALVLHMGGAHDEAAALLESLVDSDARAAGDHTVARDLGVLGMVYWGNAQTEEGLALISRSADAEGDAAARFENLTNAAWLSYELGETAKAAAFLRRASRLRSKAPRSTRARFFDVVGRTKMSAGLVEAALADFREAIRLAEADDSSDLYFAILGNYADNSQLLGDFREALRIWKRMLVRAQAGNRGWHVPDAALNYANCLVVLGRFGEAEKYFELAAAAASSSPAVRIHAAVAGIPLGLALGREDMLAQSADESVIELAFRSKEALRIGPTIAAFSSLFIARNRFDDAKALLDAGLGALRTADHAYSMLALASAHCDRTSSEKALNLMREAHRLRRDPFSAAFLRYIEAEIARRDGNRAVARAVAASAAVAFAELKIPYWQARALELAGNSREALTVYRRIDDRFDAQRLSGMFERRKARAIAAEGLTARQLEIAGLVAQGLANKEVGAQLGISEKTVENHLQVIYARLGLASRAKLIAHVFAALGR
ncbi:MAG: LuxR C-terminal-related transcriptional regulator [Vulcanimicrobiaceae bacterium]